MGVLKCKNGVAYDGVSNEDEAKQTIGSDSLSSQKAIKK